ncbi:MAG: phosphoribosylanthranilate isomerase [Betaproteobacteria bacterium]
MSRTRIKICGIGCVADALAASSAGADAIGLIFYASSPRSVTLDQAVVIASALPPFVSTVALFVNAEVNEVNEVVVRLRPAILQFHGDEDPVYCAQFGLPYLKAVRVGAGITADDLLECAKRHNGAKALLLDALSRGVYGGSGESFDWRVIPEQLRRHIVLSGGLQPANVAEAIRMIRPLAVDVSSGVEMQNGPKGRKDHTRIRQFIEEVRNADAA